MDSQQIGVHHWYLAYSYNRITYVSDKFTLFALLYNLNYCIRLMFNNILLWVGREWNLKCVVLLNWKMLFSVWNNLIKCRPVIIIRDMISSLCHCDSLYYIGYKPLGDLGLDECLYSSRVSQFVDKVFLTYVFCYNRLIEGWGYFLICRPMASMINFLIA